MLIALRSLWESSVTPALPNAAGRVYAGTYPYWTKKPRRRPIDDDEEEEAEELLAMFGIDF